MTETHRCPDCDAVTKISFLFDIRSAAYMVLDKEFVGLSDIATRLYCPSCPWQKTGVLKDAVVDLDTYQITAGKFVPNS